MGEERVSESAMLLLQFMATIGQAAVAGAPSAQPYLAAGAIRVVDGIPEFHKDRFLALLADELISEDR